MEKFAKPFRRLAGTLAFVLLATVMLAAADGVLSVKSEPMEAFYAEPRNSIDVLFMGGSRSMAAFSPVQMWEEKGFTSYNMYTWGQPLWTSYHYIKETLKTQKPKVVVVEAFGLCYGNTYMTPSDMDGLSNEYSLLMRPGINRAALALAMRQSQKVQMPIEQYSSLMRYHGRWDSLVAEDFSWYFTDHYATNKGFGPLYGTEPLQASAKPENLPKPEIYAPALDYFHKIIELSEQEGFELVFTVTPYLLQNDMEWAIYEEAAKICRQKGIPFISYLEGEQDVSLSYKNDMAEHAHVNLYGAEKISSHMATYLSKEYSLQDRRSDDSYAYWNEAQALESWDMQKMALRMCPTAAGYFSRTKNERFTSFIVTRGQLGEGDYSPLEEGFKSAGLPFSAVQQGADGGYLAVLEGGKIVASQQGEAAEKEFNYSFAQQQITLRTGQNGGIWANGTAVHLPYNAMLVAVFDNVTGELVQSVAFRPEEGCITRTD